MGRPLTASYIPWLPCVCSQIAGTSKLILLIQSPSSSCSFNKMHLIEFFNPSEKLLSCLFDEAWYSSGTVRQFRQSLHCQAVQALSGTVRQFRQFRQLHCQAVQVLSGTVRQFRYCQAVQTVQAVQVLSGSSSRVLSGSSGTVRQFWQFKQFRYCQVQAVGYCQAVQAVQAAALSGSSGTVGQFRHCQVLSGTVR